MRRRLRKWLNHALMRAGIGGGVITCTTSLRCRHLDVDGTFLGTERFVKNRKITTAFVDDIVDALQDTAGTGDLATFNDYKYHDSGTDSTAESKAQTALVAACGDSRTTGTQTENAHNIYESVATHTYGGSYAIKEHGLFNASSGGTMMDRTVFTTINVTTGQKIEYTYRITFADED